MGDPQQRKGALSPSVSVGVRALFMLVAADLFSVHSRAEPVVCFAFRLAQPMEFSMFFFRCPRLLSAQIDF